MTSRSIENTTTPLPSTTYWMDNLLIDHDIGTGDGAGDGAGDDSQMDVDCIHQHSIVIDGTSEYLEHENCIKMIETHKCLECNVLGIVIYYVPREISWIQSIDNV
jgi:hypothetical protein